ncbi:hypothetical protein QFC24_006612 [Naganishia onofrii]|uniref:Uncharacterized protein n=1 Tax=Naganishia onofrii TaxID=1851511 RepID=A0ACC2X210_9TREE|nr:hypothetical protein QFC24_006612 [Naganishia onofrii]
MTILLTYIHSLPSNGRVLAVTRAVPSSSLSTPIDTTSDDCGHKSSCLAAQQRIKNNPHPELDLYKTSFSTSRKPPLTRYPVDYWFWLLYFAIPYGFTCRTAIIETFEAVYHGRNVFNSVDANNTCWSNPFATFMYIACELLIPTAPFGGIGGDKPVLFSGKMRSRDKVIAKIVSVLMKSHKKYSARQISDYRRTIINDLLHQYSDATLPPYLREYASSALRRFAQSTYIVPHNSPYVDKIPVCHIKSGECTNFRLASIAKHLVDNGWIPLPEERPGKPCLHLDGNLVVHPFLAFFLALPGYHCQTDDIHSFVMRDPKRHGKAWWEWYVMRYSYRKAEYAQRWWASEVTGNRVKDSVLYDTYGEPPTND